MESRVELALENRTKGYNCAQAIVCTYCDLFGVDEETAFKMSECFGSGMGDMQGTCGALSGLYMLASLKTSSGSVKNGNSKAETYKLIKKLSEEFREKNSAILCKDLKGLDGTGVKRSCPGCVEDAARLFEKYIAE